MSSTRDHYFPNTEPLAADEMRIIALGTGRPFVRRAQANCSWLIELGNGDKFIMDFGAGSQANFTALEIPHQDITAYFATHLHADHVGDFAQVWIGSWTGGRVKPLVLYGPSGPEPKYGIAHFVRRQMESLAWDMDTRLGVLPDAGAEVDVHEFDFSKTGVVYEKNGVVIRSFPAIHIYDGPVSYRLEWNGLTFVFSGDTTPNRFFIENAQGADLLIHECFNTVKQLIERSGYDERRAASARSAQRAGRSGAGAGAGEAAACGGLSLLQRLRHGAGDRARDPQGLAGPAGAGAGPDGVQRHAGQDSRAHGGDGDACVAEQGAPRRGLAQAPRTKRAPKMSRWLADQQLFPKF